jgi:hypothetical protein
LIIDQAEKGLVEFQAVSVGASFEIPPHNS